MSAPILSSGRTGCATMTAAVIPRPGVIEFLEVPVPEPERGQVLVRLEGCGVCAASLAAWQGRPQAPLNFPLGAGEPGNEAWGRVAVVGEGVSDFEPGERVGVLTHAGFAEYVLADARALVALPEGLDAEPFPARALAGAVNVFRRSFIEKGQTVAVIGFGFLGALVTQLAVLAEARVIAVGRRPCALRIARQLGASAAVLLKEPEHDALAMETMRELNGGQLFDVVVEAVGLQRCLDLAGQATRDRGRLMIAGSHREGPRLVDIGLWNRRGIDVINAHEPSLDVLREGLREAVAALECGLLKPGPLYTHRFPLNRLEDAFLLASSRPTGFMKALVYL